MAVINTGLLVRGLRSEFFARLKLATVLWTALATRIASTKDSENYKWLGTVPTMREWGTGRLAKGLRTESYSVENLKYESTIEVDRDELADDQTGQIKIRVGEMAQQAGTHKDYLIGQLLINGATAGFNSYDGTTFFADDHESGDSGAQSNDLTPAAVDADVPTVAEFRKALQQAIAAMMEFKDDQGNPMGISPTGLTIVVPPSLYFIANEAVNGAMHDGSTNTMKGIVKIEVLPWLTDGTQFYLLKTDGVIRPFIFQDREPIEFNALTEDSDEGFRREKFLFGVRARYRMTYGYWQYAVRCTFTE